MKNVLMSLVLAAGVSAIAAPKVVNVEMTGSGKVTIGYTLQNDPAVITLDIVTNGVSIGREKLRTVSGPVNVLVQPGTYSLVWRSSRDCPGCHFPDAQAVITAWPVDDPPPYLVVNVTKGGQPDIHYYVSTNEFPGGFSDDQYRLGKLVMRKISAAGAMWTMGSKLATKQTQEAHHVAELTHDYYIGIYPFTQGQYQSVYGSLPYWMAFRELPDAPFHPLNYQCYGDVRGKVDADGIDWPSTGTNVCGTSIIGVLRTRTGLDLDLPTEAEWEFACRGGTTTEIYSGSDTADAASLNAIAWNRGLATNVTYKTRPGGGDNVGLPTHAVGEMVPNDYGLYDMLGNVREYCRDRYQLSYAGWDVYVQCGSISIDPAGPVTTTANRRTVRGGSVNAELTSLRAPARGEVTEDSADEYTGFRLVCPAFAK